jgi:hypothetical protein
MHALSLYIYIDEVNYSSKCTLKGFHFSPFPFFCEFMAHHVCLSDMAQTENLHPGFFHVLFIADRHSPTLRLP